LPRPSPRAALRQDEVQFSGVKRLKEPGAQIDGQFDVDRPVQTREVPQNLGKTALDEILGGAEPDPAAQFGAGKILTGPFVGFENAAGEREHRLAVRGQRHRVCIADKEPSAGRLLKPPHMLADRRLPQPEPAARVAEARRLRHGHKRLEQHRVEHGAIMIRDHSKRCNPASH
jgi:hypothetical protein